MSDSIPISSCKGTHDGGIRTWVVDRAIDVQMKRYLDGALVRLESEPVTKGPTVYLANHVSYWDGFLVRRVHQHLQRSGPLYSVMLHRELKRYPFLRWIGAAGITSGNVGSIRSLQRFLEARRTRPDLGLAVFPQGAIWPTSRFPLHFRRGWEFAANALGDPWIQPVAIHLEPGNRPKPTAFITLGSPWRHTSLSVGRQSHAERAVATLLNQSQTRLGLFGERAPDEWMGAGGWDLLRGPPDWTRAATPVQSALEALPGQTSCEMHHLQHRKPSNPPVDRNHVGPLT